MINVNFNIFFVSFVVVLQGVYPPIISCGILGMHLAHAIEFVDWESILILLFLDVNKNILQINVYLYKCNRLMNFFINYFNHSEIYFWRINLIVDLNYSIIIVDNLLKKLNDWSLSLQLKLNSQCAYRSILILNPCPKIFFFRS